MCSVRSACFAPQQHDGIAAEAALEAGFHTAAREAFVAAAPYATTFHLRGRAAEAALAAIGEHPSEFVRDQYIMNVAGRCQLDPDRLRSWLTLGDVNFGRLAIVSVEIDNLDSGRTVGWDRTGLRFLAYASRVLRSIVIDLVREQRAQRPRLAEARVEDWILVPRRDTAFDLASRQADLAIFAGACGPIFTGSLAQQRVCAGLEGGKELVVGAL